jgi:proteasome accessory factor A
MEPLRGTKEHVGALFDRCESAAELFRAITAS